LTADPSRTLSNLGEATLLQLIVENGLAQATEKLPESIRKNRGAMAETLEANMRKVIIQEMPINPAYYERMSTLLTELIRLRKEGAITYEEFLKEYEELAKNLDRKAKKHYPELIDNEAKQAFYDNLNNNEDLAVALFEKISSERPDNWHGSVIKEKVVKNVVRESLATYGIKDEKEVERIFDLTTKQNELK